MFEPLLYWAIGLFIHALSSITIIFIPDKELKLNLLYIRQIHFDRRKNWQP